MKPQHGLALLFLAGAPAAASAEVPGPVESILTEAGPIRVSEFAADLEYPWGLIFLPDGDALVTEKPGRLRRITAAGEVSPPLGGTPEVFAQGQGGLLDVELDPAFADNQRVWLSYARPGEDGTAATALGRGRLADDRIEGFETVFVMQPMVEGPNHFGGRIVFTPDGLIFLALGERFKFEPAQDLSSHLGTVVRITPEGEAPPDNPFVDQPNARPEIWSYGHRNIEAAAMDPQSGNLWVAEMGPSAATSSTASSAAATTAGRW
jgi:glucose/arabinose dehydrogenase